MSPLRGFGEPLPTGTPLVIQSRSQEACTYKAGVATSGECPVTGKRELLPNSNLPPALLVWVLIFFRQMSKTSLRHFLVILYKPHLQPEGIVDIYFFFLKVVIFTSCYCCESLSTQVFETWHKNKGGEQMCSMGALTLCLGLRNPVTAKINGRSRRVSLN